MLEDASPSAADPADSTDQPRPRRRFRSNQEIRARWRRVLTWSVSIVLGALLVSSIVGEEGYLASIAAAREEAQLTDSLTKIRLENQFLQQDARRLETDPEAVETAARRLLHMIRPGETVIHLNDAQQPAGR